MNTATATRETSRLHREIARGLDNAAASITAAVDLVAGMKAALAAMPQLADNPYWQDAYRAAGECVAEMEDDQMHWMGRALAAGFSPDDFDANLPA